MSGRWVSCFNRSDLGVSFCRTQKLTAEAQPTFILYLIPPTYLAKLKLR
jgi:hypothetical protein